MKTKALHHPFPSGTEREQASIYLGQEHIRCWNRAVPRFAQLAKCCLSTTGGERTLTTEVAERLKAIRSTWREQLIESANGETVCLLENS